MDISRIVREVLLRAYDIARNNKNEYVTPEHLLLSALEDSMFQEIMLKLNVDISELKEELNKYINDNIEKIEDGEEPDESYGIKNILIIATQQAAFSERNFVGLEHIIAAIYTLKDSYAVYFLEKQGVSKHDLLFELSHNKIEENNLDKDAIKIVEIDNRDPKKEGNIVSKYCENLLEEVSEEDAEAILDAVHCGIGVLATAHADGLCDASERPVLRRLIESKAFERYVILSRVRGRLKVLNQNGCHIPEERENDVKRSGFYGDGVCKCSGPMVF